MAYLNGRGAELKLSPKPSKTSGIPTTDNDQLYLNETQTEILGGLGDDTYQLWYIDGIAKEFANEGNDALRVYAWSSGGSVTLPDNVENLVLTAGTDEPSAGGNVRNGTGNSLNNIITAGGLGSTLNGLAGDDVLVGGKGTDTFIIDYEDGSDAIYSFQNGYDIVLLKGFENLITFDQIQGVARQVGRDVEIGLGDGELLMLRDTRLADLDPTDFGFRVPAGPIAPGYVRETQENTYENENGWTAQNLPWGAKKAGLHFGEGKDYNHDMTFNPLDLTKGTVFNWDFASGPTSQMGIMAYSNLAFGTYLGQLNPTDTGHPLTAQVGKIDSLTARFDLSVAGNSGGHNVSFDIWFTAAPEGAIATTELMIWLHKGAVTPSGTRIGTYSDGFFEADVYVGTVEKELPGGSGTYNHRYIAYVAKSDMLSGSLNITTVMADAQARSQLSASDYLSSVHLGAEVVTGKGALTINDFDMSIVAQYGSATTKVEKQIVGSGTVVPEIFDGLSNSAAQTLAGGSGNDIYVLGVGDNVTESAGSGIDEVRTARGSTTDWAQAYVLPSNVENFGGTASSGQGVRLNGLDNVVTMGAGADLVLLGNGGNDRVYGGGGDDFIHFGTAFTNGDLVNGGSGNDTLALEGSYTLTFDANDMISIEKLAVYGSKNGAPPSTYSLTTVDANVVAGQQLLVIASGFAIGESLRFNGSAELDGTFDVRGGTGFDMITGGTGNDRIWGNLGADNLKGGWGADTFEYTSISESLSASGSRDIIVDFSEEDLIDLSKIDSNGGGAGDEPFKFMSEGVFTGVGQVIVTVDGTNWLVQANTQGDLAPEFAIIVVPSGPIVWDASDFVL